jgi:hypothetical protein
MLFASSQKMDNMETTGDRNAKATDPEEDCYVNIGVQNWMALRQNWKKHPPNYKPPPKRRVDKEKVYEELIHQGNLSQRVPLADFVQIVFEVWETEGVN